MGKSKTSPYDEPGYYDPPPYHQPNQRRAPRGAPRGVEVSQCTKYFLFFINVFFWLVGAFLLGFGIWGLVSKNGNNVSSLAEDLGIFLDPMFAFIIVGSIIFILGFFGCIGALRENTCMIKFFTYFLILIFLAELTLGILGYVYQDKLFDVLDSWFEKTIILYLGELIYSDANARIRKASRILNFGVPLIWQANMG